MSKQNALSFILPAMLLIMFAFQPKPVPGGHQALVQHFHQYVDENVLPGTVIFLQKDDVLFKDVYGYQDVEEELSMRENSVFRLASMTKPILATAIMQLVEQQRLKLDDRVSKYIPKVASMSVYDGTLEGVKQAYPMTIRHLLSHTSGSTSGLDFSAAGRAAHQYIAQQEIVDLRSLTQAICGTQLAFQPGKGWAYGYSNDLLAAVLEEVTQQPIEQYLTENILQPLEMNHTRFQAQDKGLLTTVYATKTEGGIKAIETAANSRYTNGKNFGRGNGGLVSTAGDYLNFCRMLLQNGQYKGKHILKASSIELMRKNSVPEEYLPFQVAGNKMLGQGYGFGFGIVGEKSPFGTAGDFYWPGALYTYFFVSPENNAIGIFMTQLHDRNRMGMIWDFHNLATQALN